MLTWKTNLFLAAIGLVYPIGMYFADRVKNGKQKNVEQPPGKDNKDRERDQ